MSLEVCIMIPCLEKCKYQKNGECTYDVVCKESQTCHKSDCAYFEQE